MNMENAVKVLADFIMSKGLLFGLKGISPSACSLKEKYPVLTLCFCHRVGNLK